MIASQIERILAEDGRTGTQGLVAQIVELFEGYGVESAKPKDAEGWRDIASAPTPVMIGASFGLGRDYDKLVWFHAGVPTHWRPLPEPPSAMLPAAGDDNG